MKLGSAIHFCDEVLSGKLYSNQLVIKDGRLIEKADAKISTVDDALAKDLKPVVLTSDTPKVILSLSQVPQSKLFRPPTLVSVGSQVYPSLIDNAMKLGKCSQRKSKVAQLGLQISGNLSDDGSKLEHTISERRARVTVGKQQLPNDANRPFRKSQKARQKPAKFAENNKKYITTGLLGICQVTEYSDMHLNDTDVANKNSMVTLKTGFDSSSSEGGKGKTVNPKTSVEVLDSGGKFQCSFCTFSTNNVRKISEHNREHQRVNNICYYCERRFESSAELSVHVDEAHADIKTNDTPFVCSSCPSRFRTRTQLVAHLPKHSSTRPFICAKCGASFKWRNTLHNHAATHTLRKEHLCDICGYATAHRGQLREHRLVHTGGTMRCSWDGCDFHATRTQSLKYHLLTHTQEKPHQCEVCGQSFSLAKNLKRHMLLHVNTAAKHNCSRCPFSTLRYDKLKEHLHKQHKVGSAPERRVRITDLVNLDVATTIEGLANQPEPQSTQPQFLVEATQPVDMDINAGISSPDKQQAFVDGSVLAVEPTDFLLDNVQSFNNVFSATNERQPAEDVTVARC